LTAITADDCRGLPIVRAVHDTTSLNFSTLTHTTGLGPIGASGQGQGLHLHSTLAVRIDGVSLGILHQRYWARPLEPRGDNHQSHLLEDKESVKWLDSIAGAGVARDRLPEARQPRLIHVLDREGDIHEVLETVAESRDGLVIRNRQDRLVDGPLGRAYESVSAAARLGMSVVKLAAREERVARQATLELRAITVTLTPSRKQVGQTGRKCERCGGAGVT
jgi:hypothetical protein